MELLQNSGSMDTSCNRDLKLSKTVKHNVTDCQESLQLKIPEESKNNAIIAPGTQILNDETDICKDDNLDKSNRNQDENANLPATQSEECSPSYSGATEPIDENSPSYSCATEENLDGVTSPTRSNSPDPNCAICLGKLENKSFTDSCFHQFCFTCLLEWSKVKPECPLCKQSFKSIIHNVRSIEDYDQYYITVRNAEARRSWRSPEGRRFRYPSTLTHDRRRQLEFEHSIEFQNYRLTYAPHLYRGLNSRYPSTIRSTTSDFRRNIYNNNFWVVPQSNGQRYRETSPEFFHQNPACTHRLIPWLNRELLALLPHSENQVSFILELILALITRYDVKSSEFYEHIFPYLQDRTTHFIHEFYHFARSTHDMTGYDRNSNYEQLEGSSNVVNQESTSSSPDSVVEVPVEMPPGERSGMETRSRSAKRRFLRDPTFQGSDPRQKKSKTPLRSWDSTSPITLESNTNSQAGVFQTLDLDMPGTSRQDFTLPFRPWDIADFATRFNSGFGSSTQESDEDCVIVNCLSPAKKTPPLITIPSSSDEETESSNAPQPEKKNHAYEKPATRKNRCTFHYDYSSDSCSEQTDGILSSGTSNSESRKSRIKSVIGSISCTLSIPSSSSEHNSNKSHKKHKKHKKHKHHKHRHRRNNKEEKD